MIKHISFDLWLTLIKSHPGFKEKRAVFLQKEFNPGGFSVPQIMEIVQNTDKVSDRLNEINGQKVPTNQMYRRILHQLGNDPDSTGDDLITKIKAEVHTMFLNLLPGFLNPDILPMLQILKNEGYTMNISSNTGFIEGSTIAETMQYLRIAEYFVFCIFSDQIGASKPAAGFYDKVFDQVNVEKHEVLHVGDNIKADYQGAIQYGFKALHITNQQYTINDIKRLL